MEECSILLIISCSKEEIKKEEALMLQAWCIATFTSEEFKAIIREVFKKVVA